MAFDLHIFRTCRNRHICYIWNMTKRDVKAVLDRVLAWPEEDQEELAEVAREIEARQTELYQLTKDEREAVERALAEMRERKFASDEDVAAIFRRARSSRA
jgi:hypothetical protein